MSHDYHGQPDALSYLDALSGHGWPHDFAAHFAIASETYWSCELRFTASPNAIGRPDHSHVIYVAGQRNPEEAARRALDELDAWLQELPTPPFPGKVKREPAWDARGSGLPEIVRGGDL